MDRLRISELKTAVLVALGAVYDQEFRLIRQHCHEQNIVGAFYHYFRCFYEQKVAPLCVDMEYSRQGELRDGKNIDLDATESLCPFCGKSHSRRIRSDFVVHEPGTNRHNRLVIEFKGSWSEGCLEWDRKKLSCLTLPVGVSDADVVCGYQLGASIVLYEDAIGVEWFAKGHPLRRKFILLENR